MAKWFVVMTVCAWCVAMAQWGGVAHVSVAGVLGVITGTYLGKAIGLVRYGPFRGPITRSTARAGAVVGLLVFCVWAGLNPDANLLFQMQLGLVLLSILVYWVALRIIYTRRDAYLERDWSSSGMPSQWG
jgi:hypothetical protein